MTTLSLPRVERPGGVRWAMGEVLAHPMRMATIMLASAAVFVCAFAAGYPATLAVPPAAPAVTSSPDVRLMPHPVSPVARPTPPVRVAPRRAVRGEPPRAAVEPVRSRPAVPVVSVPGTAAPASSPPPVTTSPSGTPTEAPPTSAPTDPPPTEEPPAPGGP